jgi:2-oxoglutarate/2-oxoacid ferredoxin oxidoreductase subunit alpha
LVICGEAGQGIQTVESILVQVIKKGGYHLFSTKEYMSRVRGGQNSTQIRVSSTRVRAFLDRIDILLALSSGVVKHLQERITPHTLIIGDERHLSSLSSDQYNLIDVPLIEEAQKLGGPIFSNVIAAGLLSCLLNIPKNVFDERIRDMFARKGTEILKNDLKAGGAGYKIGKNLDESGKVKLNILSSPEVKEELLLNGTDVVGWGCLAGGCNFMSSYPMTPSTPLQVFMASNANEFNIIFEQAEDEIAAINMALGASYAGARSMVATSGSGFALMEEAIGLSGMIETPVVIYLGQRPGPAVGLPTRTSQEDLNLALYSGPGEFPRIIFAPGKMEDAFKLSQLAFNLADKYQIPVFILSDQYFADIYYNAPSLPIEDVENNNYIIKTTADYKRYLLTPNGISTRGIPGFGDGVVVVDSDEHDEGGHITEDLDLRRQMVDKRLKKLEGIQQEVISPEIVGGEDYQFLVLGWGSTYWAIFEALDNLDDSRFSFLHFKQVYPLHSSTKEYLDKAEEILIFENNANGQFGNLIKLETGRKIHRKFLKYNGMPFSVEEVEKNLSNLSRG